MNAMVSMEEFIALKERVYRLEQELANFTDERYGSNRSDIDYMAMELDVDLDQDTEGEFDE